MPCSLLLSDIESESEGCAFDSWEKAGFPGKPLNKRGKRQKKNILGKEWLIKMQCLSLSKKLAFGYHAFDQIRRVLFKIRFYPGFPHFWPKPQSSSPLRLLISSRILAALM